jgi:hypothetical protein
VLRLARPLVRRRPLADRPPLVRRRPLADHPHLAPPLARPLVRRPPLARRRPLADRPHLALHRSSTIYSLFRQGVIKKGRVHLSTPKMYIP